MLKVSQLRELIIRPALKDLSLYSLEAEELLVFTCAVESNGGEFIKQLDGPALGIYQMEPATYNDVWQNFIAKKSSLVLMLGSNFNAFSMPDEYRLIYDLRFATAMTRLHYERVPQPLPNKDDANALWNYYKTYYNTSYGAAQRLDSIKKYILYLNS